MINDHEDGGAKMLDIHAFNSASKATWITKCHIIESNLNKHDLQVINIKDMFVKEVLEVWSQIHFQNTLYSIDGFSQQNLRNNSLIRIENKPVFFRKWHKKGIVKVKHLQDEKNPSNFLKHIEFQTKYRLDTPYLQYVGLISSLLHLSLQ